MGGDQLITTTGACMLAVIYEEFDEKLESKTVKANSSKKVTGSVSEEDSTGSSSGGVQLDCPHFIEISKWELPWR